MTAIPVHGATDGVSLVIVLWMLCTGCWNVGAQPPPLDLGGFITPPTELTAPYDMVVVGLQEIGSSGNRDTWTTALQSHLNLAYEGRWGYVAVHLPIS